MKHTKGRSLHNTGRRSFKNSIVVNIPSEKALVYWLNSLGHPSAILVDSLEDITRKGDETISEVVHELLYVPGENLPLPKTVASALTLLSKDAMWNEMSPSLSNMAPVDIALKVQQNDNKLLRLLLGNLRVLMERKEIEFFFSFGDQGLGSAIWEMNISAKKAHSQGDSSSHGLRAGAVF